MIMSIATNTLTHLPNSDRPIRVLIVDDSALVRQLLTEVFANNSEFEVVGTAPDPIIARDKIKALSPDVLTLDVEMPRMNGIEFLERLMRLRPMPVVMISTLTIEGADVTLQALELGAVDFVSKPTTNLTNSMAGLRAEILMKVRTAARARIRAHSKPPRPALVNPPLAPGHHGPSVIAIGASTGGVEALGTLLAGVGTNAPGIVVVQHMPGTFTGRFAARLDAQLPQKVIEASDGCLISKGMVLIAPGGKHFRVIETNEGLRCRISDAGGAHGHIPSVDMMFHSLAPLGPRAVGVILTGMGRDGAEGMLAMHQRGALTIAQEQRSCVVFGMPRAAIELGGVTKELPITRIAAAMIQGAGGEADKQTLRGG
jgi:two-component system, chemotaxis family, protein-glutamate methylesterase/glutaminase